MLAVIRSQSGMWWESRRLLQHLRSPAAPPPHPCSPPPGLPQPSQPTRCPGDPSPRCHQGWSHPVWPGIRMGLSSPLLPSRIPPCPRPLRAQGGRDASRQPRQTGYGLPYAPTEMKGALQHIHVYQLRGGCPDPRPDPAHTARVSPCQPLAPGASLAPGRSP